MKRRKLPKDYAKAQPKPANLVASNNKDEQAVLNESALHDSWREQRSNPRRVSVVSLTADMSAFSGTGRVEGAEGLMVGEADMPPGAGRLRRQRTSIRRRSRTPSFVASA